MEIARRLRATRDALGLSQTAFAKKADIAVNTYNQWEKGRNRPEIDKAMALCEAHGITLDWIYRGDPSGLPWRIAERVLPRAS